MTPKQATTKPAEIESPDIEVVLSDDRAVTIREPQPADYGRLIGAQMAVGKIHAGVALAEADENNVRSGICLLSVVPVDADHKDGRLTEDDMLALSPGDWIYANQLGRRNLTLDQRRLLRGERYNAQKRQGARTDLTSGQNAQKSGVTTAAAIAAEEGVSTSSAVATSPSTSAACCAGSGTTRRSRAMAARFQGRGILPPRFLTPPPPRSPPRKAFQPARPSQPHPRPAPPAARGAVQRAEEGYGGAC